MRKSLLALLVSAYINQCLCEVIWQTPQDGQTDTLVENTPLDTTIITLDASNAVIYSFALEPTGEEDKFRIEDGSALKLKAFLDYETRTSYTFILTALKTSTLSAVITYTVKIADVNDEPPVFTSAAISKVLMKDTDIGTIVYTVEVTDPDSVGSSTFSITGGNTNAAFSIDTTTGVLTLDKALDPDVTSTYSLVIEATDSVFTATMTLIVTVNSIIWQTPQDGQTDTLVENTSIDTTIITLDASNAIIYSFALEPTGEKDKFRIESGNALKLKESLDYETRKSYTFILTAQMSSSLSAVITYTVNITDVNDEPPAFTSATSKDLTKDTEIGTIVYTAEVTDPDSVGSSTFSITGGNTNADFSIDKTTGDLTLDKALYPDVTPTYSLVIEATDSVFSASMTLSVTVNRIAWTDPVKGALEDLPEDTAVNTVIKTLIAETATIYIITDQSPHLDVFGIDNTNELVLLTALDYENTTSHTISFRAIDSSGKSADITYIINVTDVNDLEPVFVSGTVEIIPENIPVGTTIHTASATDDDTVGTVTYSITAGNDGGTFVIVSSTGEITLNEALNPNSTADLSYSLLIEATDSVHPVTQSLTVGVKSVPALVVPADDTISITENVDTSGSFVVLTLESTDLDGDPAPKYTIESQSHPGTFSISADNTQLITTASFDREQVSEYDVTIRVTDSSEFNLSSVATFTVTIQDGNDVAPTFTSNATINLPEHTPPGNTLIVHTVTTDDPDITGTVTYAITARNTNDDFFMFTNGSIMMINALNASITPKYTLMVLANDTVNTTPFNLTVYVLTEASFFIEGHRGQTDVTVDENDGVIQFTCEVDSNPSFTLKILFNGEVLDYSANTKRISMILSSAACLNSGEYTCESNDERNGQSSRKSINLYVNCSPRSLHQMKQNITCALHVPVTLTFTALAYPYPGSKGFAWFKEYDVDWLPVLSNADLHISSSALQSNLTISNVSNADYGRYRLTVTNDHGSFVQYLFLEEDVTENEESSDICQKCRAKETGNAELITSISLGVAFAVLAIYAASVTILYKRKTENKGKQIDIKETTHRTYANIAYKPNEQDNDNDDGTTAAEGSEARQYTDLVGYSREDKTTYEVLQDI